MDEWVWPAYVGILGGAALFVVFMIPIVAIQYRMYGRFTWLRFLGAAALSVYGVALVAYTLLPLPDPESLFCPPGGSVFQSVPFNFVSDIQRDTAGLGISGTLTSRAVLQVAFNVILFVPWGVITRRYLSWNVPVAVLSGALASLAIEFTQYTGLWGLYDCAYRLGDVDDLITNTLGALLGALIAPYVLWFMPQRQELFASRGKSRPVTVMRRWLGMVIDYAALTASGFVLVVLYRIALMALGAELPAAEDPPTQILAFLVPAVLVFYLPALSGSGASLGQRAVWLRPEWQGLDGGRAGTARRLLRASITGGLYTALAFLAAVFPLPLLDLLSSLVLLAAFIAVPMTGKRGLSGLACGARMIDSRTTADATVAP